MATHSLPEAFTDLSTKTSGIITGLKTHGKGLGITQNRAAIVAKDLEVAKAADAAFEASKKDVIDNLRPALRAADTAGRKFIGNAKKVLAVHLGDNWSESWVEAGFTGKTIQVPTAIGGREKLLQDLATYFSAHPEHESVDFDVSAARAAGCHAALSEARKATDAHPDRQKALRMNRDKACAALLRRLRATITELELYLDRNSILWASFGLTAPALMKAGRPRNSKPAPLPLLRTPMESRWRSKDRLRAIDLLPLTRDAIQAAA